MAAPHFRSLDQISQSSEEYRPRRNSRKIYSLAVRLHLAILLAQVSPKNWIAIFDCRTNKSGAFSRCLSVVVEEEDLVVGEVVVVALAVVVEVRRGSCSGITPEYDADRMINRSWRWLCTRRAPSLCARYVNLNWERGADGLMRHRDGHLHARDRGRNGLRVHQHQNPIL